MKEVLELMRKNSVGFLGTVEEGKPRVRPFEFQFEEGGKYYFCTANTKDVWTQLKQIPYIEFACTSKEMVTVRIRGMIKFSNDVGIKNRIIEHNELIRSIYQEASNPVFEVFYLDSGEATVSDFSGKPPRFLFY